MKNNGLSGLMALALIVFIIAGALIFIPDASTLPDVTDIILEENRGELDSEGLISTENTVKDEFRRETASEF